MIAHLLLNALAWLPLWLGFRLIGHRVRPGRVLLGAALTAFVGGMCCAELRRYGFLQPLPGELTLPVAELRLHEASRFFFLGGAAALVGDFILDRLGVERRSDQDSVEPSEG